MENYQDFLDTVHKDDFFRKKRTKPIKSFIDAQKFILKNISINSKILDIGCNDGRFLLLLKDHYKTEGWDISRESVKSCQEKGINARVKNVESGIDDTASNQYNAITMFSTLEHIKAPQFFLAEINRILKKDGLLIIEVPNAAYFMNWIAMCIIPKYIGLSSSFASWDHCNHFTTHDLRYILSHLGFKIIKIEKHPFLHPSLNVYAKKIKNCKSSEYLAKHPIKTLKWRI